MEASCPFLICNNFCLSSLIYLNQSNNIHLYYGLLHDDQLFDHMVVLLPDRLIRFPHLLTLGSQSFITFYQGFILFGDLVFLRTGNIHEVIQLIVLHLVGELQVFLQQGLLLAFDTFVGKKELELSLCLQLGLKILEL